MKEMVCWAKQDKKIRQGQKYSILRPQNLGEGTVYQSPGDSYLHGVKNFSVYSHDCFLLTKQGTIH